MTPAKIRIFYPADPLGIVPGGIDTFLRGMVKFAPQELEFSLVGMTTDTEMRPLGRWTHCDIGARGFDFYPVVSVADAGQRGLAPLSLRFSAGAWRHRARLHRDFDVFDFHRVEPSLLYSADPRPKNAYFHQDPQTVVSAASDNLWRRLPAAYERIEARAVSSFSSAWCVRESGVETLRRRYPSLGERIRFVPTWVDAEVFSPVAPQDRQLLRYVLAHEFAIDAQSRWIISVGRLDTQKNPELLLAAFIRLVAQGQDLQLLIVGDGVLRRRLEHMASAAGVYARVHFLGLRPPHAIADLLRAADVFALSSAYEGMPMALLEAMGCGTPAVVSDVGEVRRVVRPGVNGVIAAAHAQEAFAAGLAEALDAPPRWRTAALAAVQAYQPEQVLAPLYDNYQALAQGFKALRTVAVAQAEAPWAGRRRAPVVEAPIDVLRSAAFLRQVMLWAKAGESRGVAFCNVHSAVLASRDTHHHLSLQAADLVVPDGAPIAWTLRAKGFAEQDRVDGPGSMWQLCRLARDQGVKIGLFGSTEPVLAALQQQLEAAFPGLQISFRRAPPFREASAAEDEAVCREVGQAGVGLLFVGLGCPKQERWIAQHRGRIGAVMLGVGAAFDFHAGTTQRAPPWMRERGLEWLYRLACEPRRLGWRYLTTNSRFIGRSAMEAGAALMRRFAAGTPPPQAFGEPTLVMDTRPKAARPRIDRRQIEALSARIDALMPPGSGHLVAFIASGSGEGTSTVARAYALANASPLGRRVLLVSASRLSDERPGLLDALRSGRPLDDVVARHSRGVFVASLGPIADSDIGWNLLARKDLLDALRGRFELVAIDMPAPGSSSVGLKLAPMCDGVVVVLEAEKTRAPVAAQLIDNLHAVQARVLGTVLNKRRCRVPERLYRWL